VGAITESDSTGFLAALPGVVAVPAREETGAPEAAWGDTFFFYDPPPGSPEHRRMPFATIVRSDYPRHDERSQLGRPGVFRLNVGVGRERFEELVGHPPSAHERHVDEFDYAALDRLLPHPVYAAQGWVSILNPGERTGDLSRTLLAEAHDRARRAREGTREAQA
jgi:hypothetical protein